MIRKLLGLTGMSVAACWFLGRGLAAVVPSTASSEREPDVRTAIDEISQRRAGGAGARPGRHHQLEIVTSYSGLHALWLHRLAHQLDELPACRSCRAGSASSTASSPASRSTPARRSATACSSTTARAWSSARRPRSATTSPSTRASRWAAPARRPASGTPRWATTSSFGAGAKVLGAIKVGDNAKIGAGSVVVSDVPRTRPSSATPAARCCSRASASASPTSTTATCRTPWPRRSSAWWRASWRSSRSSTRSTRSASGKRQEAVRADAGDARGAAAVRRGRRHLTPPPAARNRRAGARGGGRGVARRGQLPGLGEPEVEAGTASGSTSP